jgi:putative membrane protein
MEHMNAAWHGLLIGFPVLLGHLALTTGLLVVGLGIYAKLEPYHEIARLREGNVAAAIVFSGQMLALAIPLAAMMANSVNVPEIVLWGVVTVILQFIAIVSLRLLLPGLPARVARGEIAPALVYASGQIVTGLLTAAALSS